jgi:hypothetical protein
MSFTNLSLSDLSSYADIPDPHKEWMFIPKNIQARVINDFNSEILSGKQIAKKYHIDYGHLMVMRRRGELITKTDDGETLSVEYPVSKINIEKQEQIVKLYQNGHAKAKISRIVNVSLYYVNKTINMFLKTRKSWDLKTEDFADLIPCIEKLKKENDELIKTSDHLAAENEKLEEIIKQLSIKIDDLELDVGYETAENDRLKTLIGPVKLQEAATKEEEEAAKKSS